LIAEPSLAVSSRGSLKRRACATARAGALFAILLGASIPSHPAAAQALGRPGESTETRFRSEIRGHWFAWLGAQEEGDTLVARAKIEEILKYAQQIGIRRLSDLALSATLQGRRELLAGKPEKARESFEAAIRLDPDLPEARWGYLSVGMANRRWGKLPGRFIAALRATAQDAEARRVTTARLISMFTLTAALVGAALVLVLILSNARTYYHDLWELSGHTVRGLSQHVAAIALFFAPLLVSLDVLWFMLVLFVFEWGYAPRRQRFITAAGLLAMLPLLPVADRMSYTLALDASPILRGAEALAESRYDQRVLDNVEAVKNLLPEDADVRFLLGRLYQALGQNDRAVTEYSVGSQVSSRESRCLVNRGNIHFVDGDFGSAQEDFQEALKREPKNIAARYNLSLVYAETFRTVDAAQTLQEVRALDARSLQRYQEAPTSVKVVSQSYSMEDASRKIKELETDSRSRRLLGHFRSYRFGDAFKIPLIAATVLALFGAYFLDRKRQSGRGYSMECQKCGRTYCRLCKPPGQSDSLCSQCVHVYLKKDGVAIETTMQKVEEVKRRRIVEDRFRILLNLCIPGSAAFRDSRPVIALVALSLFVLGLVAAFVRDRFGVIPRPEAVPALGITLVWLGVAMTGWIIGQVTGRPRPQVVS
ncbi:MAG: tetratricopeptide repeat protein, partial [Thermoanaerobaculia bacterium]